MRSVLPHDSGTSAWPTFSSGSQGRQDAKTIQNLQSSGLLQGLFRPFGRPGRKAAKKFKMSS